MSRCFDGDVVKSSLRRKRNISTFLAFINNSDNEIISVLKYWIKTTTKLAYDIGKDNNGGL